MKARERERERERERDAGERLSMVQGVSNEENRLQTIKADPLLTGHTKLFRFTNPHSMSCQFFFFF